MTRKSVSLLIVMLIAGLAPASAIIGYCARMPCCHHATPLKVSADTGDCCKTVGCYDAPSAKLTGNAVFVTLIATRVLVPAIFVVQAPKSIVALSPSPPTTQQRLAILSTLLI